MRSPRHRFRVVTASGTTLSTRTSLLAAKKDRAKFLADRSYPNIIHVQQWSIWTGAWQRPDQCSYEKERNEKRETNHGGKRKGAGRPKGSGTGRTVKTSSINLPPDLWDKLDAIRGEQSRSAWIADRIKLARKKS